MSLPAKKARIDNVATQDKNILEILFFLSISSWPGTPLYSSNQGIWLQPWKLEKAVCSDTLYPVLTF